MTSNFWCGAVALTAGVLCFDYGAAGQQLPAVSGPNGKFEFNAGALTLPSPTFLGRAAGAITLPIGERFGVQADFSLSSSPGFTTSAALHLFTRDPASYLIGGTLGFVHSPGSTVLAAGPEAEFYMDRWTVEAWGGLSMVRPTAPAPMRLGAFALADVGYYPTDNWRVTLGVSSLDGYNALQIGSEYLFDTPGIPIAATGDIRVGQDGAIRITAGLRGYIGPDPHKTLIRRQREDDPADRGTALYVAAGETTLYGDKKSPPASAPTTTSASGGNAPNEGETAAPDPDENANGAHPPEGEGDTGASAGDHQAQDGAGDAGSGTGGTGAGTGDTGGDQTGAGPTEGSGGDDPGGDGTEAGSGDDGNDPSGSGATGDTSGGSHDGTGASGDDGTGTSDQGTGGEDVSGGGDTGGDQADPGSTSGDEGGDGAGDNGGDTGAVDPGTGGDGGSGGADTGGGDDSGDTKPDWCEYTWNGQSCTDDYGVPVQPPATGGEDTPAEDPRKLTCIALGPGADWHGDEDGGVCYNDGQVVILP